MTAYDGTARATRNHARANRRAPYWGHALGTVDFGTYSVSKAIDIGNFDIVDDVDSTIE